MKIILFLTLLLFSLSSWSQSNSNKTSVKKNPTDTKNSKMALRLNPTGLVYGFARVGLDVQVEKQFTVGGQIAYLQVNKDQQVAKSVGYGIRGQFFTGSLSADSWYIATNLDILDTNVKNSTTGEEGQISGYASSILLGHRWHLKPLSLQVGAGLQSVEAEKVGIESSIENAAVSGLFPAIEFILSIKL